MDDKRAFCQFEADENLFERTYNGVPYWQMLRFMVCEGAYSERIEHEDAVKRAGRKKQLRSLARNLPCAYIRSLIQFKKLKKCDVVCFLAADQKKQLNRFFDYWSMPPDIRALRVYEDVRVEMFRQNNYYAFVEPYCKGQASYYLKKIFGKIQIDQEEHVFLQELERKVRERFGRSVSAQRMEFEIVHWLETTDKAYERFFEKFFSKVDCKAIAVVCYYQNQLYSAYRVAKKRGIRVIEFQHGAISAHPQYWFEDQRGLNNYTPDYCLTFGAAHSTWTKMLPTTRVVAVGFPYQETQIDKWKNLQTEEKTVVIYPQALPEFEVVVAQFAEIMGERGYRIILKLHPSQAENYSLYYPLLSKNKELEVITNQDKGIYYWLKLARHHVVSNTTVGLEAVAMAHTNICVATNIPHAQTQPLLDWGVASSFTNAAELIELVENPPQRDTTKERSALWKPNGEKNIQDFFSRLKAQNWPEGQRYVE